MMGTKNDPAAYDCYANAEPDEPMFVLLARDGCAAEAVRHWVELRRGDPGQDEAQLDEALECAFDMEDWRRVHRG